MTTEGTTSSAAAAPARLPRSRMAITSSRSPRSDCCHIGKYELADCCLMLGGAQRTIVRMLASFSTFDLVAQRRAPAWPHRRPAARRCCCCTAIRRRTRCGIGWRRRWPSTSRVVMMDLRGYGDSGRPAADAEPCRLQQARDGARCAGRHGSSTASQRFGVLAHDRGARVAHRLAADHPAGGRAADAARHRADAGDVREHLARPSRAPTGTGSS